LVVAVPASLIDRESCNPNFVMSSKEDEELEGTPDWSCQIPYSGLGASIMIIMTRAVAL